MEREDVGLNQVHNENDGREKRKELLKALVHDPIYVPMKEKELAALLSVASEDRKELRSILQELLAEGELMVTSKGKYQKNNGTILTGTFISNPKGFGFVEVEGREEDLFIPEEYVSSAFHKDTVQVALLPPSRGRRQEAKIVKILARVITTLVGTFEWSKKNYGFVIPDMTKLPCDVFVDKDHANGAVTGSKVVVEIVDYGGQRKTLRERSWRFWDI